MTLMDDAKSVTVSLEDVLGSLGGSLLLADAGAGSSAKDLPRLGQVKTTALGKLLPVTETFCEAHSKDLAPRRASKQLVDQRGYLESLVDAIVGFSQQNGARRIDRAICLGGLGVTAVAARRQLPASAKVVSVQTSMEHEVDEEHAWQKRLARLVALANGCPGIACERRVPEVQWRLLVVEGLDTFAISDGVLQMLRDAAPFAAPAGPVRVIPGVARISAQLRATQDFARVCADCGGGFDLRAVCGEEVLSATAPLLMLEEDNALLQGSTALTDTFQALQIWDAREGPIGKKLAAIAERDKAELTVTCTSAGVCSAIVFWWEVEEPEYRNPARCVQWLSKPRQLQAGDQVRLTVSRSMTRVKFEVDQCVADGHACLPKISFAALRHAPMLRDDVRNRCYSQAIARAVRRAQERHGKASVLELGSGTGLLLMMAKRAGADRITGCEVDPHVCELAARVADANGMSFGSAGSDFELIRKSFQNLCTEPELQGQFNVLVAELMDNCGLGEHMWPFFSAARRTLMSPDGEHVVIPRRLRIFAALVSVELAAVRGIQLWPADPFFFGSTLPRVDGVARSAQLPGLELDKLEDHWRPASNVVEVLSIDFAGASLECEGGSVQVEFTSVADGSANGVVWFWHAELDEEQTLVTAPQRFWNQYGHTLPDCAERASGFCWKQACQVLEPTWLARGQVVRAHAVHDTVSLRWQLEPSDPCNTVGQQALLEHWEKQRGLTGELFLTLNELTQSWFKALSSKSQAAAMAHIARLWGRENFRDADQAELLQLLGRLGDFGIHPSTANIAVPHFFGSLTAGAYKAENKAAE